MSVRQQVSNHLTPNRNSIGVDQYDHAIKLIDTTIPGTANAESEASHTIQEASGNEISDTNVGDSVPVVRIISRTALNQEFNRRRYARFQEQKYNNGSDSETAAPKGKTRTVIDALDNKRRHALERLHIRAKKAAKTKALESAIDVLYENQRGLFIFGYPLYSSRSLLNFDPSAWTNADFRDSAVDIRSAQVPDPTWVWSWKRWYVDMSGDVDEQGWQYSLMFGKKFSWHGNHPWFHSAVRRRRWLRQRVKIEHAHNVSEGHDLAQDYFTIHPTSTLLRGEPGATSANTDKASRSGGRFEAAQETEDEDEDIDNLVSLLHIMKNTTVDRKKLDAVKNFLKHGGNDIQLLPQVLSEIWKLLLYQTSARELLNVLEAAEHGVNEDHEASSEANDSKIKALQSSIQYIREHLTQVEYYSDARAMEEEINDHEAGHEQPRQDPESLRQQDKLDSVELSKEPSNDVNIETTRVSFRGIPKSAGLDVAPGITRPITTADD